MIFQALVPGGYIRVDPEYLGEKQIVLFGRLSHHSSPTFAWDEHKVRPYARYHILLLFTFTFFLLPF
jgi:hypothetical protein